MGFMNLRSLCRFIVFVTFFLFIPTALFAEDSSLISTATAKINIAVAGGEVPLEPRSLEPQKNSSDFKKYIAPEKWAISLVYPGGAIRHKISDKSAWELKVQTGSGVFILGPRYYHNITTNPILFWGIEADYLSFKGKVSKGTGYAVEGFIGMEIFLFKGMSLQTDIGPAYIGVKDNTTSLDSSGLQFVVNSGINFYF